MKNWKDRYNKIKNAFSEFCLIWPYFYTYAKRHTYDAWKIAKVRRYGELFKTKMAAIKVQKTKPKILDLTPDFEKSIDSVVQEAIEIATYQTDYDYPRGGKKNTSKNVTINLARPAVSI